MTVGIYIRVSTEEQAAEGYSISAQKEKLKSYCHTQDWNDFKFYVDEGRSAKDLNRPLLQELLSHIKKGLIDTVLVYRLDRLTRSVVDLHNLLSLFDDYDCSFVSATEAYDTSSAMGRFFITIISSVAQFERENTSERVSFAMAEKARQGEYTPKAPFGYDKGIDGKLVVNEQEKAVYLDILDRILRGYSLRQTCHYLDMIGVKTIRSNDLWSPTTLKRILTNPAVIGAVPWNGKIYTNNHEALIDEDTYNKLIKLLEVRSNGHATRRGHTKHIFKGKIICPNCGRYLTGTRTSYKDISGITSYNNNYRCGTCKNRRDTSIFVSEKKIESAFIDYLKNFSFKQTTLKKTGGDKSKKEQEKLLKELASLISQRKKYQKAWAADLISDDEFSDLMKETNTLITELESKQKNYVTSTPLTPEQIKRRNNVLKKMRINWENLTQDEKIDFISMFVQKIEITAEKPYKVLKISFL